MTTLYDHASLEPTSIISRDLTRKRSFFWIIPCVVLVMYLLVILAFFVIQKNLQENIYFVSDIESSRQKLLLIFVLALSATIIICLLLIWHFSRVRAQTENALYNETTFRRAMENSMSTGMRVLDMKGKIIYVNPAFCRLIGWNESDLLGSSPPYPYWRKDHLDYHQGVMHILLSGKTPNTGLELETMRRDGSSFTARMYVSPLRDTNGQQFGWMTSMTDITEPKRIREALTATHERFMTVLESLDDAISVTADSPNGLELLFANRTYRRLFGSDARGHKELLKTYNTRLDDNTNEYFNESSQAWFEIHHRTLTWTDGRKVRMQVARDITQRHQYQEELNTQQEKIELNSRLTTMGEMASSLAHELNQPLAAIVNYNRAISNLLKSNRTEQEALLKVLEKSIQQAERAGRIISRIREFVKRSEPRRQAIQIRDIIDNTMDLAMIESRKHNIKIIDNIPFTLPEIYADPILIEQVLFNLIKNGLEAMSDCDQGSSLQLNAMQIGKEIDVSVTDYGHGIKDPDQLFAPFFSTKREGLGMGLNICRTIIESHNGRLWAEHNPEGGCIFHFRLPCVAELAAPSTHPHTERNLNHD
ncbi:PAS domain-containing sensor histidine kinase [Brackiella oedipodis]|uniref:PAS domain-containing sensor histidine kinase n=1 Tax=Brackiella oedipodis TaxID=124225 RepID=UPI00068825C1|nr:PAS domain S-box protein [Brackiella oedipodis]